MTEPLLNPTDFALFQAKDPTWFLGAVGETIQDHCGWHIYPEKSDLNVESKIGHAGIIMLPTLNLVSVDELRIIRNGVATVVDPAAYVPKSAGYIELQTFGWHRARGCAVSVDITHGYETVPKAVAEVGYELTGRTMEKPSGVVTDITRGPTRMKFAEFGAVLSEDQEARLAPYTLVRV